MSTFFPIQAPLRFASLGAPNCATGLCIAVQFAVDAPPTGGSGHRPEKVSGRVGKYVPRVSQPELFFYSRNVE